jgi:hypothetical protein
MLNRSSERAAAAEKRIREEAAGAAITSIDCGTHPHACTPTVRVSHHGAWSVEPLYTRMCVYAPGAVLLAALPTFSRRRVRRPAGADSAVISAALPACPQT